MVSSGILVGGARFFRRCGLDCWGGWRYGGVDLADVLWDWGGVIGGWWAPELKFRPEETRHPQSFRSHTLPNSAVSTWGD